MSSKSESSKGDWAQISSIDRFPELQDGRKSHKGLTFSRNTKSSEYFISADDSSVEPRQRITFKVDEKELLFFAFSIIKELLF
jgi:hypothetical protein